MNIVSWNVNGIRAITSKDFKNSIDKLDPDILCIQETKAQDEEVKTALTSFNDYHLYANSADKKGYSGIVTLSKDKPLSIANDMGIKEHDLEGRILCTEYTDFYLVNVYVPNSGQQLDRLEYRKKWDQDFLSFLKTLEKKKPVIACGDFNVAYTPIDLSNPKSNYNKTAGYTQTEIDGMNALIQSGFVDSFRFFHPNETAYTYWSYRFKARKRNIGWRIDYFLISKTLVKRVKSVKILSDYYGSDHCPISLNIDI
jgi:exodeoxyribonuclease-3